MNNCTIDFKELQNNIKTLEFLVSDLYDMKEILESNNHRTPKQEGMLVAVNHLLKHVER